MVSPHAHTGDTYLAYPWHQTPHCLWHSIFVVISDDQSTKHRVTLFHYVVLTQLSSAPRMGLKSGFAPAKVIKNPIPSKRIAIYLTVRRRKACLTITIARACSFDTYRTITKTNFSPEVSATSAPSRSAQRLDGSCALQNAQ